MTGQENNEGTEQERTGAQLPPSQFLDTTFLIARPEGRTRGLGHSGMLCHRSATVAQHSPGIPVLDELPMWPVVFAIVEWTATVEKKVVALVKAAVA